MEYFTRKKIIWRNYLLLIPNKRKHNMMHECYDIGYVDLLEVGRCGGGGGGGVRLGG